MHFTVHVCDDDEFYAYQRATGKTCYNSLVGSLILRIIFPTQNIICNVSKLDLQ